MWLQDFPVAELVKRDSLPAEPSDKPSRVEQLLAFFGVCNVEVWEDIYAELACAFRTSKTYEAKPKALAAWLRLGEIAAQDIYSDPYDRKRLQDALPSLRALTQEKRVEVFTESLRAICAACGIAVIFIPELPGSRASGVARWLTPTKALVQLSFRYRTDDHLWFTFFHEIGHILRHGKTDVWIEVASSTDNPREAEADAFSRDTLIPRAAAEKLAALKTLDDAQAFADSLGIAPGIVVGRLQHDQLWPYSKGNQLKRQLALSPEEEE
jgi:HTH-type transcriptional regulator/antitoxin HigA